MNRRRFALGTSALALAASLPLRAQQKYPSKSIKFVVPFAAGGGGDVTARMLAQRLTERLGNPIIVENRTGAGGNIGSDFVLKSPADGYTLLNMSSSYPIQAAVTKLPYDPIGDMQPIVMVSRDPVVLLVNQASPLKSTKDLLDAAKKAPDKLTYGSAGVGSIAHLGMEELAYLAGIKLVHVPYKGSSQAFADLLGGNVDMMLTSATFGATYIKSGRVRALGVAGTTRLASIGEVPTFEEQGIAGYNVVDWKAVAGPKGIPADVVAFLNKELNAVLQSKEVVEKMKAEGTTAVGGTPEQMMDIVKSDIARWKRVAEMAKVKIE
ncbi:MAG: tripartite tricarboxylate transporter substrate binding protein [Betaproteobacteria bacterium]|nr:tripartite tricarboxylate transporter substrate binding protein [Betaproteobacteria bacterium]